MSCHTGNHSHAKPGIMSHVYLSLWRVQATTLMNTLSLHLFWPWSPLCISWWISPSIDLGTTILPPCMIRPSCSDSSDLTWTYALAATGTLPLCVSHPLFASFTTDSNFVSAAVATFHHTSYTACLLNVPAHVLVRMFAAIKVFPGAFSATGLNEPHEKTLTSQRYVVQAAPVDERHEWSVTNLNCSTLIRYLSNFSHACQSFFLHLGVFQLLWSAWSNMLQVSTAPRGAKVADPQSRTTCVSQQQ